MVGEAFICFANVIAFLMITIKTSGLRPKCGTIYDKVRWHWWGHINKTLCVEQKLKFKYSLFKDSFSRLLLLLYAYYFSLKFSAVNFNCPRIKQRCKKQTIGPKLKRSNCFCCHSNYKLLMEQVREVTPGLASAIRRGVITDSKKKQRIHSRTKPGRKYSKHQTDLT
jgi:hypothetical protein